jgi:hypothetical protein
MTATAEVAADDRHNVADQPGISPENTMQLHIAAQIKAFVREGSVCWNGAVELLQPVMIAFNISGVAGSLLALAGMLTVAARRGLVAALHQEA